jgi:hypothetical protein
MQHARKGARIPNHHQPTKHPPNGNADEARRPGE